MNILFVTPYPPSRIRSRSYGFIQHLREKHTVTILSQVATPQEWNDVEVLRRKEYQIVAVPESKPKSLLRSGLAVLSSYPIQAAYARSSQFLDTAQRLCGRQSFDVIHVEHLRGIASMEPLLKEYPLTWDAVDCLSSLWKQVAVAGKSKAIRAFSHLERVRTEKYEAHLLNEQVQVSTISEVDRDAMLALLPKICSDSTCENAGRFIEVLPNGIDTDYFFPTEEKYRPYNIVFSGKMSYHANIAAVHYLYHQIMPLIWEKQPMATLTIVGSKPPRSVRILAADERVEVTGYVDDIRPYIRRAHIMMSPMVYSVGLQNKVLEAMALGTPSIISHQSARALGAKPNYHMFVAASVDEFAAKAFQLMDDSALRTAMSLHGCAYVESYHNWHVITERLLTMYQRAIKMKDKCEN
ncbi:MAG: glycosyltransferase [Ktedonobacteraceae bacterium]